MRPLSRTASTGERSRRSGYPNSAGPAMNSSPFRIPAPTHITMHISSQCRAKCQTWLPRPGLVIVVSDMPAGPLRRLRAGRSRHRTVTFPVVPAPPVDDTCRFPCRLKTPSGGSPAGPDRVTMKAVLDVRRLLVLRAVARHGSIAAARALGYSQPAVSHHIHRLEAETGVRLVIRDGRGVTLTDAGQSMVAR